MYIYEETRLRHIIKQHENNYKILQKLFDDYSKSNEVTEKTVITLNKIQDLLETSLEELNKYKKELNELTQSILN